MTFEYLTEIRGDVLMSIFDYISIEETDNKKLDPDNIPLDQGGNTSLDESTYSTRGGKEDNKEFEPVDTEVVHTDEEYYNAFSEMNELTTESDSIESALKSLESFITSLETIKDKGGLDQNGATLLNASLPFVYKSLGIEEYQSFSLESFKGISQRQTATSVAVEAMSDVFYKILEAFKKFINYIVTKLKDFYRHLTGMSKKVEKKCDDIDKELKDNPTISIELPSSMQDKLGKDFSNPAENKIYTLKEMVYHVRYITDKFLLRDESYPLFVVADSITRRVKKFLDFRKKYNKQDPDSVAEATSSLLQNLTEKHKDIVGRLSKKLTKAKDKNIRALIGADNESVEYYTGMVGIDNYMIVLKASKVKDNTPGNTNPETMNTNEWYLDYDYIQVDNPSYTYEKYDSKYLPGNQKEIKDIIDNVRWANNLIEIDIRACNRNITDIQAEYKDLDQALQRGEIDRSLNATFADILSFAKSLSNILAKGNVKLQNHLLQLLNTITTVVDMIMVSSK